MKRKNISIVVILFALFSSCDRDGIFEKEQYKNIFALISDADNVSRKTHTLGKESTGYIAASLGGTNPTTKEIVINLVEDFTLIDQYNKINFDVDASKYAQPMPPDKYDIDGFQFKIPAGEINGRLPIRIRPDGLSPDSIYFIPLRIESHTSYEANPRKSFVLYSVRIKNWWAIGDGSTSYTMRAKHRINKASYELQVIGSKIMHPLSKNQVRIMAGNETFESEVSVFNRLALILTILDDNKVVITPYRDVNMTQVNGDKDFPNTFRIENDGFKTYKTFLLRYNYVSGNNSYEVKEELRLEFDADAEAAEEEQNS